jgi:putative Ig domain-containing protein
MSISTVVTRGFGGINHRTDSLLRRGYASYTGLPEPPPAGYEYGTYTMTWGGNGYWLGSGSVPAVQLGDVFLLSSTFVPGNYTDQINADGTIEIFVGGDTSRQQGTYDVYRVASNALDGYATIWINEAAPIWNSPSFTFTWMVGTPVNYNLNNLVASPSGDVLTFSLLTGVLTPGLTLSSAGILSGTPTQAGAFGFAVNATDAAGISTSGTIYSSVSPVYVPPYNPPATTAVFGPVVSAWTADATHVTADSVSFTCDGADLINGGGTDSPQPPSKGPAINKSQYLRF